jgi:hypothetical protein
MTRLERVTRLAGTPFRAAAIGLIRLYRLTLSGWLGGSCRFYPSCSHYAEAAIRSRGFLMGAMFAAWRVLRCNPFGRGGLDPAPGRSSAAARLNDAVIHRHRVKGLR